MKNFVLVLMMACCVLPCFASTYVAVVETVVEHNVIGRSERLFLTDKLRESAKKTLPSYMGFVIMTRENIQQMLPPGKKIEDCEGECLIETGKNINAHYIAQARVGQFGKNLTLTVELYETMGNNLVGSFTARQPDADGLLAEIEHKANEMFSVVVAQENEEKDFLEGFGSVNLGSNSYKATGTRNFIINVSSEPSEVYFSVDGRPHSGCNKTPCEIPLKEGNHRFSFVKEMYLVKDTVFDVNSNGKLHVTLNPNFGTLVLEPRLWNGVGTAEGLTIEIDGEKYSGNRFRLPAGTHQVKISHDCYESASFSVNVKSGSDLKFDSTLKPIMGGVDLNAIENDLQKLIPVYVNDSLVGKTPFLDAVPVCSKITVGENRDEIPLTLKKNETQKFTYDLGRFEIFVDSRDKQEYKTVKIGKRFWFAQNLNYASKKSWCYEDLMANCDKYGRLYSWKEAKSVCPAGWHLPDNSELEQFWLTIGGEAVAGKKLKSKTMWKDGGRGMGMYGFSVYPAGYRNLYGSYGNEGDYAYLWSSTKYNKESAYYWYFNSNNERVFRHTNPKENGFSVRCVRD